APGSPSSGDLAGYFLAGQVDHGNIVRRAIRGVKGLAVRRKSDSPRTFADLKGSNHAIGWHIDDKKLVSATGTDVKLGRIAREQEAHGLDYSRLSERNRFDGFVLHRVHDRYGAIIFGVDVGSRAIGQKCDRTRTPAHLECLRNLPRGDV